MGNHKNIHLFFHFLSNKIFIFDERVSNGLFAFIIESAYLSVCVRRCVYMYAARYLVISVYLKVFKLNFTHHIAISLSWWNNFSTRGFTCKTKLSSVSPLTNIDWVLSIYLYLLYTRKQNKTRTTRTKYTAAHLLLLLLLLYFSFFGRTATNSPLNSFTFIFIFFFRNRTTKRKIPSRYHIFVLLFFIRHLHTVCKRKKKHAFQKLRTFNTMNLKTKTQNSAHFHIHPMKLQSIK